MTDYPVRLYKAPPANVVRRQVAYKTFTIGAANVDIARRLARDEAKRQTGLNPMFVSLATDGTIVITMPDS